MRIGKALLILLLVLFSTAAQGKSLDFLLSKLESDLAAGKSTAVIEGDVRKILEAKQQLPISYVPEVNYLLNREVEKIPPTRISSLKRAVYFFGPFFRAVCAVLFLIVFYSFIFYFQQIEGSERRKLFFTLFFVLVPVVSLFVDSFSLFLLSVSASLLINLGLEKKRTAMVTLLGLLFMLLCHTFERNVFSYIEDPRTLYRVKVERDGYLPEYLIDLVLKDRLAREVEKASNLLAVGNFKGVEILKKLESSISNPELESIVFNNLGYYYFMTGKYRTAEKYFSASLKIKPFPFTKYNLYLTCSALLKFDKASRLKAELESDDFLFMKAVPVIIHVPVSHYSFYIPLKELLAVSLGTGIGILILRLLPIRPGSYELQMLKIPGITSYINGKPAVFVMVFIVSLVSNYVIGRMACSI